MENLFWGCESLKTINGLSGLNTSNVTTMSGMFYDCKSLTEIDLKGWDTSYVLDMSNMFCNCASLTSVTMTGDLSNQVSCVNMFDGITTEGTFYYNPAYDYSMIIAELPAT